MTSDPRSARTGPLDPKRDEARAASAAALPATSITEVQPEAPAGAPRQQLFEVDTAADVIDATDGVLSLREAIETANAVPGLDIITFADALRGERIVLDSANGSLEITDDLIIDGDPLDRGRVDDTPVALHGSRIEFVNSDIG